MGIEELSLGRLIYAYESLPITKGIEKLSLGKLIAYERYKVCFKWREISDAAFKKDLDFLSELPVTVIIGEKDFLIFEPDKDRKFTSIKIFPESNEVNYIIELEKFGEGYSMLFCRNKFDGLPERTRIIKDDGKTGSRTVLDFYLNNIQK